MAAATIHLIYLVVSITALVNVNGAHVSNIAVKNNAIETVNNVIRDLLNQTSNIIHDPKLNINYNNSVNDVATNQIDMKTDFPIKNKINNEVYNQQNQAAIASILPELNIQNHPNAAAFPNEQSVYPTAVQMNNRLPNQPNQVLFPSNLPESGSAQMNPMYRFVPGQPAEMSAFYNMSNFFKEQNPPAMQATQSQSNIIDEQRSDPAIMRTFNDILNQHNQVHESTLTETKASGIDKTANYGTRPFLDIIFLRDPINWHVEQSNNAQTKEDTYPQDRQDNVMKTGFVSYTESSIIEKESADNEGSQFPYVLVVDPSKFDLKRDAQLNYRVMKKACEDIKRYEKLLEGNTKIKEKLKKFQKESGNVCKKIDNLMHNLDQASTGTDMKSEDKTTTNEDLVNGIRVNLMV